MLILTQTYSFKTLTAFDLWQYTYTHTHSREYTHSVPLLCLLVLSPHLLSYSLRHTLAHTHTSSQWCITCSGLAQRPKCLCIRCHTGSNVMSLASCGAYWSSLADTAVHRHGQIILYNRLAINFHTCWQKRDGFFVHSLHTHTQSRRSGKRQRSRPSPSPSLMPGDRLIPHINIRASSSPAALHVLN